MRDERIGMKGDVPGDNANDGAPAKADTTQREERHIQPIGDLFRARQHLSVVVRNVLWDLLLHFLHLAIAIWDFGEIRVLVLLLALYVRSRASNKTRLTSSPATFLLLNLSISLPSSLRAAYLPTIAAMMDYCWTIKCR